MITILCVLKSGGVYDVSWVEKLQRGVDRNMSVLHRFVCLSDIDVPCERLALAHDWPGWWAKVEIFRPGVVVGPTMYLDLDTIITGSLDALMEKGRDFAMLANFNDADMVGSGVMWFDNEAPAGVYERFVQNPQRIMDHYAAVKHGSYMGDQAFIWDVLGHKVDRLASPALRSYKKHCRDGLPDGTSIVCFHGRPRPSEINPLWLQEHWY